MVTKKKSAIPVKRLTKKSAEKPAAEAVKPEPQKPKAVPVARYVFGIGRRKTAVATVKLFAGGDGTFTVNKKPMFSYFPTLHLQKFATEPLEITGLAKKYSVVADARGGGINSQAQAVALGLSRALVMADQGQRLVLKKEGLLSRDSRKKERKKPGLKRARRAPQGQKRKGNYWKPAHPWFEPFFASKKSPARKSSKEWKSLAGRGTTSV